MKLCTLALLLGISSLYGADNNGMNNPNSTNNGTRLYTLGATIHLEDDNSFFDPIVQALLETASSLNGTVVQVNENRDGELDVNGTISRIFSNAVNAAGGDGVQIEEVYSIALPLHNGDDPQDVIDALLSGFNNDSQRPKQQ